MRVESEEEGGMKVGKERELIEEEDTIAVAEGRGEREETEVIKERGEGEDTGVAEGRGEGEDTGVAEGRGEGEDTEVIKERGEGGTTEANEERGEEGMTAVVKGREERGVIAVTEGRGEMETAHLMMTAMTLQRLLVGEAKGGSHTRKKRRELVNLEEEEGMMTQLHPLRNDHFQTPRDIHVYSTLLNAFYFSTFFTIPILAGNIHFYKSLVMHSWFVC